MRPRSCLGLYPRSPLLTRSGCPVTWPFREGLGLSWVHPAPGGNECHPGIKRHSRPPAEGSAWSPLVSPLGGTGPQDRTPGLMVDTWIPPLAAHGVLQRARSSPGRHARVHTRLSPSSCTSTSFTRLGLRGTEACAAGPCSRRAPRAGEPDSSLLYPLLLTPSCLCADMTLAKVNHLDGPHPAD